MKNAMQLKALMRNFSKEYRIPAQAVLQNYMLERLLERISVSAYRERFVIKGGFLVAAMVGMSSRTTMDLDATVKNYPLSEESIRSSFNEIISRDIGDGIHFTMLRVEEIREADNYPGFRVSFEADFDRLKVPLKVDLTSGDAITPDAVGFKYKLLMEERTIDILTYNIETLLAEKFETVVSRGRLNTRLRDFYDIYLIMKLASIPVNTGLYLEALTATVVKRESQQALQRGEQTLQEIRANSTMADRWLSFQREYEYAREIPFESVMDEVDTLGRFSGLGVGEKDVQ